jgi:hypothetical protein
MHENNASLHARNLGLRTSVRSAEVGDFTNPIDSPHVYLPKVSAGSLACQFRAVNVADLCREHKAHDQLRAQTTPLSPVMHSVIILLANVLAASASYNFIHLNQTAESLNSDALKTQYFEASRVLAHESSSCVDS